MAMGDVGTLKETQVQQQIGKLASAIDLLEQSTEQLAKRLEGVLHNPQPQEESKTPPQEPIVMLANNLRSFSERIILATKNINDIRNRIEL